MATKVNITKTRSDTRRHTFTIKDATGKIVDISLWSNFSLSVTSDEEPIDASTLIEKIVGNVSTDGTDGRCYFSPSGTMAVQEVYYDAQALDDNGEKITFAEGTYTITQDRGKD